MQKHLVLLVAALFVCGCPPPVVAANGIFAGLVAGPLGGAEVEAIDSASGTVLSSVTTDAEGTFSLSLGNWSGDLLVCATGGTYRSPAVGTDVDHSQNTLCAFVGGFAVGEERTGQVLSPVSTLHAVHARCKVEDGQDAATATDASAALVNEYFVLGAPGYDFRTTVPFDVTTSVAPGLTPEVWAGLLQAGLSQAAKRNAQLTGVEAGVTLNLSTLTTVLAKDLQNDCVLDGQDDGVPLFHGDVALNADALRGSPQGLLAGMLEFLDFGQNASGLTSADVRDSLEVMSTFESALFGPLFAPPDLSPPDVVFTAPVSTTLNGVVTVQVSATDNVAVGSLTFTSPEALASTLADCLPDMSSCTLEAELNTGLLGDGPLVIAAEAADPSGNRSSARLDVVVDNELPEILIDSPALGEILSGTVTVTATATDEVGIASLVLQQPLGLVDTEPAPGALSVEWDTTTAPEGTFEMVFVATDANGIEATRTWPVTIDNIEATSFSGVVHMGGPVVAASVTAYAFSGGELGDPIGDDVLTADDGSFQILSTSSFEGPVALVAANGGYEDVATGQFVPLTFALTAVLPGVTAGEDYVLQLTPWTALATAHAGATGGFDAEALAESYEILGLHLRRPNVLPLAEGGLADITADMFAPSDPSAIYALATAALSRLAADISVSAYGQVGALSLDQLVLALLSDARDGQFDGQANGTVLYLAPSTVADSYTLRQTLAAALHNFVQNKDLPGVVQPRNATGILSETLQVPGGLIENLAINPDQRLFPADQPPLPFDDTPPTVLFQPQGVHSASAMGDELAGTVVVRVSAQDLDSTIQSVDVIAPVLTDLNADPALVEIELAPSVLPNLTAVAAECGLSTANPPLVGLADPEKQICFCVDATDSVDLTTRGIYCISRPDTSVAFVDPTPPQGAAVAGSFQISVAAASGFTLESLVIEPAALVDIDPDPAVFTALVGPSFVDPIEAPAIVVTATATDVRGTESVATRTFERPPLAIDVLSPAQDAQLVSTSFPATHQAVVSSGYPLVDCTWSLDNELDQTVLSGVGTIGASSCSIFGSFGSGDFVDGAYTYRVFAEDVTGQTTLVERPLTKDTAQGVATFLQPAAGLHTNGTSVDLVASVVGGGITGVNFSIVNPAGQTQVVAANLQGQTASYTLSSFQLADEGTYSYFAEVSSMTGGDQYTSSRSFVIDRTPPTITSNQSTYSLKDEQPNSGTYGASGSVTAGTLNLFPTTNRSYTVTPVPTIYKWTTRLDQGSPVVAFSATDPDPGDGAFSAPADIAVQWDLGMACPTAVNMGNTRPGGNVNATLGDSNTAVDLSVQDGSATLCFAAVATDEAGNQSATYTRSLRWHTVPPPLFMDASDDTELYDPTQNPLDFQYWEFQSSQVIWGNPASTYGSFLCSVGNPFCDGTTDIPRDHYGVAHAVLYNPWDVPVKAGMGLVGRSRVFYHPTHYVRRGTGFNIDTWWGDETTRLRNPFNPNATYAPQSAVGEPRFAEHCQGPLGNVQAGVYGFELINNNYTPGGQSQQGNCYRQSLPGIGNPLLSRTNASTPYAGVLQVAVEVQLDGSDASDSAHRVAYFALEADGTLATLGNGKPLRLPTDADGLVEVQPGQRVVALAMTQHNAGSAAHGENLTSTDAFGDCMLFQHWDSDNTHPMRMLDTDYPIYYSRSLKQSPMTDDPGCRTWLIPFVSSFPDSTSQSYNHASAKLCGNNQGGTSIRCEVDRAWWQADRLTVYWGNALAASARPTLSLLTGANDVFVWDAATQVGGGFRRHLP